MDVYLAVSNPTRRRILDLLRGRPRPAGELGLAFPALPQPSISRHLRILREAGLVGVSAKAQQRIYSLRAARLQEVDGWISAYRGYWTAQLDVLETHLDREAARSGRGRSPPP